MTDIIITQSMMTSWQEECPLKFKHRYILKDYPDEFAEPQDFTKNAVRRGKIFEIIFLGKTAHSDIVELTDKEKKSVYYERMLLQAEQFVKHLEHYGITDYEFQIRASAKLIFQYKEQNIEIIIGGTYDILAKKNGKPIIIDIKNTGDITSEWGDYCWGTPEKMKLLQAKHYPIIEMLNTGEKPLFEYWVYDLTPDMGFIPIQVDVSDENFDIHKNEVIFTWNEIMFEVNQGEEGFQPKPKYDECKFCLTPCSIKHFYPEVKVIKK